MSRITILELEWEHRYVAIFRCFRRDKEYVAEALKVASGGEIESDADLRRVLGALQKDLIAKRIYRYADNPTSRLLTFRSPTKGQRNEGQERLNALLRARSLGEVRAQAQALANRYTEIPNIREGVLIFLISRGALGDRGGNCAFVFKCDYEAISQVTPEDLFRQVPNAIVERTKKGALYPYFHKHRFDDTTIRVFDELGQTQYWLEFLGLGERTTEHVSLQAAVIEQAPDPIAQKYKDHFEKLPAVRPLTDDKERVVEREDRLYTADVQAISDRIVGTAGRQMVTLRLGEVRVTAPLSQYGRTWMVAEEAGQRYILIKGVNLENRTRMLTPIDLADFPPLRKAIDELGLPVH